MAGVVGDHQRRPAVLRCLDGGLKAYLRPDAAPVGGLKVLAQADGVGPLHRPEEEAALGGQRAEGGLPLLPGQGGR